MKKLFSSESEKNQEAYWIQQHSQNHHHGKWPNSKLLKNEKKDEKY